MSDRELLERAARAIGMPLSWDGDRARLETGGFTGHAPNWLYWNPLKDDGQAMRLAVTLGLCVTSFPGAGDTMVGYRLAGDGRNDGRNVEENWGDDPHAATRRAIVRAAAEIGRQM